MKLARYPMAVTTSPTLLARGGGCVWAAVGLLCLFAGAASAADWPTYRADAARSGWTAETLPSNLSLRWIRKPRHAPRPAWLQRDTRMPFDFTYHTVIVGKTLFFGSSADGKVYALDTATGAERWTFFTGGPVRFAPAVWKGRVFVVSDDGWLYCLAAADGKLLWKLRGGPRADMLLGNDRMISRWPARGGPVVADGVLYFAAGIWPTEGVFIRALDPATGNVLWCNDSSGSIEMDQPHSGARAKSGVSAHGYLVVAGDRLLVPTGRAVPAAFDRTGGKFLYFHLQRYGALGGSSVVAGGSSFFNSNNMFDVASGNRQCRGVATSALSVTPKHIIYAARNEFVAVDRVNMWTHRETIDRKGKKVTYTVLSAPVWRMKSPHGATHSLIVAGSTIIAGRAGRVSVLNMTSKSTLMAARVDGIPYGLSVGDGRLFVSTDKGTIYCFDDDVSSNARVVKTKHDSSPRGDNAAFAIAAEEIIRRTSITEGYCVDLGCGDGRLAIELANRTKLHVFAVEKDSAKVEAARRMLDAAGLYGVRVTVHQADPAEVSYPNYFADLVVSGRSVIEGNTHVANKAAKRLQRPCGGIVCVGKPGTMKQSVRGPLEGAGNWTHQYTDIANTLCSSDTRVKGPLEMLWFRDTDFLMSDRHGRGPAPLVAGGRMFVEGVNALRAVNVYNGRTLWEFPLKKILMPYHQEHLMGVAGTGSNFCLGDTRVYIHTGNRCLILDMENGRQLAELNAPARPDGKPGTWGYIACKDRTLFGSLANKQHLVKHRYLRSNMSSLFTESLLFFAMDARTGQLKWSYTPEHSIRHNAVAMGNGCVYLIDRPLAPIDDIHFDRAKVRAEAKRLAAAAAKNEDNEFRRLTEHKPGKLLALDMKTGKVLWKTDEDVFGTMLALSEEHGVLLMAYQPTAFRLGSELGGRMAGIRAGNGVRLWDIEAKYDSRPVLNSRTIYAQPGAWDLLTGEQLSFKLTRSYGCGIVAGSTRMLVFRSATLGYFDLKGTRQTENYGGIRPGCWINAIPAGGLVLLADAASRCTCSYLNQATIALQPCDGRNADDSQP